MHQCKELVDGVQSLLREHLNVLVDSPDVDLLETGLVDSLGLVELILQLEKRFEVSLPMEALEIDDFRSINRIAGLVTRLSISTAPGSAERIAGASLRSEIPLRLQLG